MSESHDNASRRRQLGIDPASGRYRSLEEQAALRLEPRVGPLQRDPTGTSDWIDAQGVTYDAVGPVPAGRLNVRAFSRQIDRHLLKQGLDKVVIDLTDFNASERRAVFAHLRTLGAAERARIILQWRRP
ncbi:hypothetical protein [Candidatus Entotheonella palauensis]|uniref:tRNA nuclease CdiA C-terminal domain-containing protein n=1 Tax=Candidatus Entotheonella gemina TaxID=1429439 RepID=W4M7A7_9BACT|nr:hypothetical protein [Candidatus Entotheonella palauensis]ETX05527.1 MAG: hypothetical protein ETSY2_22425 [Candidatus Entotheonella gemina]